MAASFPPYVASHRASVLQMACYGDSRSYSSIFGGPPRINQGGYANWAAMLSRGRVVPSLTNMFSVPGETSAEIAARLPSVLASNATVVVLLAGINDATGAASPDIVEAMARAIAATGRICILIPETPRSASWAANRIQQQLSIYIRCRELAAVDNIYIADAWDKLADPAGTGGPLATMSYDGTHPTPLGYYWIGRRIADILEAIFPVPSTLPAPTNGGLYDATYNPYGILNSKPLMGGTAGTNGAGCTGTTPDSWISTCTANLSAVGSRVTDANGVDWQQYVVSGTASNGSQSFNVLNFLNTIGNLSTADNLIATGDLQVDAGTTGLWGPSLEFVPTGSGSLNTGANYGASGSAIGVPVNVAHAGVVRTPVHVVQAGISAMGVRWMVRAESGAVCSMTFRVRTTGFRKVAAGTL